MALCWQLDGMSGTEKAVLIALADRADDVGMCWPSIATLAAMTCFTDRAVRQSIRSLSEKKLLTVVISPGGKSNRYIVNPEPRSEQTRNDVPSNPERHSPGTTFPRNHVPSNPEPRSANPEPRSPKPSITIKEPPVVVNTSPSDVDPKLWADFLTIRKAKKAPVTETAIAGIRREAEAAGIDFSTAIAVCCERGWAGFKADWHTPKTTTTGKRAVSNDDWRPPELRSGSEKVIEAERV